jgi:NADH:ubiquinone oxidoreductase subunit 5 (subunit L)/multisubunit Na+/H+ antiporter MnhA subunit
MSDPSSLTTLAVILIPTLPLLAALAITFGFIFDWNRDERGENSTAKITIATASISFVVTLLLAISALFNGAQGKIELGQWLSSGEFSVKVSFLLDHLSLIMATLIGFIILVITRFSINYLHREAGFQRFFILLSLFHSAMLLIVLAGNAVLVFIGWELAGVSSYLLIAYSWHRETATRNAGRAFVTNRIGDAGFLLAIVFSFYWLGTVEWGEMLTAMQTKHESPIFLGIIVAGFMLAAFTKSAQFPFCSWITRALEGPTPSSAVFYGSIMVHAGVYLLLRLQPLLEQLPFLLFTLIIIGTLTVAYSYIVGLVQTDVKSSFMFSTLMQVGLMMIWIGLGWSALALFHLVIHAIWRAYQFLHAPSFMQMVQRPARPVPLWLSKQKWLYTAALQRFWLDDMADWLFTKPTQALAHEAQAFDEQVIDRMTGMPSQSNMLSTLSNWEAHQQGRFELQSEIGIGRGLFGKTMQTVASILHWFEENLVLKGSGDGLMHGLDYIGHHIEKIDALLSKPRYLLLLIMATFVIVL